MSGFWLEDSQLVLLVVIEEFLVLLAVVVLRDLHLRNELVEGLRVIRHLAPRRLIVARYYVQFSLFAVALLLLGFKEVC